MCVEAPESASEDKAPQGREEQPARPCDASTAPSSASRGDCGSFLSWDSAADVLDDGGRDSKEEAYEGALAKLAACLGRRGKTMKPLKLDIVACQHDAVRTTHCQVLSPSAREMAKLSAAAEKAKACAALDGALPISQRKGRLPAVRLEETLAAERSELESLREQWEIIAGRDGRVFSPTGGWKADCRRLSLSLESLAADALDVGDGRAMAVFEQTSAELERVAMLLGACEMAERRQAEFCDGEADLEWQILEESCTVKEYAALCRLGQAVEDCITHPAGRTCGEALCRQPATLLRFLRARDGSVEAASAMFREFLDWRWSFCVEEACERWFADPPVERSRPMQLMAQYGVHTTLEGSDRYGLPVHVIRWAGFDCEGALRELGEQAVLHYISSLAESISADLRSSMLQHQRLPQGIISIWDVGNYGDAGVPHWWSRMSALVRFAPKIVRLLQSNYPELIRKIFVIRCGPLARLLYRIVTPVLTTRIESKCKVYGWSAAEWANELREEMPGAALPRWLVCDDVEALAAAEPRGGLFPAAATE